MNNEASNELATILVGYRARLHDVQEREASIRLARANFIASFRALKTDRIGAVLAEFAAQLNQAGHHASVVDQQEASDRNGQFTPASMSLRVVPARIGDSAVPASGSTRIEITFSANQQTMKVLVSSTNNGSGNTGRRGDYDIAEVTTEFVETNVLRTIREGFALAR